MTTRTRLFRLSRCASQPETGRVALTLFTFALFVTLPVAAFTLPRAEAPSAAAVTVTVIGRGLVEVPPDLATVRIGVETQGPSVDGALAENRKIIAAMRAAFVGLGIAEEDLQTANYSFSFDRSVDSTTTRAAQTRYYRVSNLLTVVIRDLGATADLIDAAVVSGANQMWGVEFGIADPGPIEWEALEAAALDARERAAYLAGLEGLALGEIVSMSESMGYGAGASSLRLDGYGGAASNVDPGLIRFLAEINVVYTLVPPIE